MTSSCRVISENKSFWRWPSSPRSMARRIPVSIEITGISSSKLCHFIGGSSGRRISAKPVSCLFNLNENPFASLVLHEIDLHSRLKLHVFPDFLRDHHRVFCRELRHGTPAKRCISRAACVDRLSYSSIVVPMDREDKLRCRAPSGSDQADWLILLLANRRTPTLSSPEVTGNFVIRPDLLKGERL